MTIRNFTDRRNVGKIYETFFNDYDSESHISHLESLATYSEVLSVKKAGKLEKLLEELEDQIYSLMLEFDKSKL